MIFYRLVAGRYASEAWSGGGANQYGGRWNHKGHPAVYGLHVHLAGFSRNSGTRQKRYGTESIPAFQH